MRLLHAPAPQPCITIDSKDTLLFLTSFPLTEGVRLIAKRITYFATSLNEPGKQGGEIADVEVLDVPDVLDALDDIRRHLHVLPVQLSHNLTQHQLFISKTLNHFCLLQISEFCNKQEKLLLISNLILTYLTIFLFLTTKHQPKIFFNFQYSKYFSLY